MTGAASTAAPPSDVKESAARELTRIAGRAQARGSCRHTASALPSCARRRACTAATARPTRTTPGGRRRWPRRPDPEGPLAAAKLDLFKKHRADYVAPRKPTLVAIGPARYLTAEGRGAPAGAAFQAAVGALYAVAFTVKRARKAAGKGDYKIAALEGLWWGPDRRAPFSVKSPKDWRWKLLIRTPAPVSAADLARARKALLAKGKVAEVAKVKLETIREGRSVQMLHVGGYDKEPATLEAMLGFAAARGLSFRGVHHEIYLSDPRRTAPARLRTILRHPVR